MSLAAAYGHKGGNFAPDKWLTDHRQINEGDTFAVQVGNVRNVDTKFDGPGWAFFSKTADGSTVKVESPWVRTNREGKATDLAFVFLGLLRAALKVSDNSRLPAADTYAYGIDSDAPTLNPEALRDIIGGRWVRIQARRVRRWGTDNDRQDVEWRVVGPATAEDAPTGNAPAEQAAAYADDDLIPF